MEIENFSRPSGTGFFWGEDLSYPSNELLG
jgi:hypothetical protein